MLLKSGSQTSNGVRRRTSATFSMGSVNKSIYPPAVNACLLIFCFFSAGIASEKTEIDNAWVHVVRITQAAHEKSELHERPATVVVYLSDLHQRITGADGKVR